MEVKKIEDIEPSKKDTIVTVGVFDGVHLAHISLFKELIRLSEEKGLLPLVLTFYPHPDRILRKAETPLIQTLEQRIKKIKETGIETVIPVRFDMGFSNISAEEFMHLLIRKLRMKAILVGENFRFGKGMEGNVNFLKDNSQKYNYEVFTIKIFEVNGLRLSSSLIRDLVSRGMVEETISLLGRAYSITGRVVRGYGIGKKLIVPTINISTTNEILPQGVFITELIHQNKTFPSVTNIGKAPTLKKGDLLSIETHIIGVEKDFLNEEVEIFLLKKIREEIKFSGIEELKARIEKDIEIAREYFSLQNKG